MVFKTGFTVPVNNRLTTLPSFSVVPVCPAVSWPGTLSDSVPVLPPPPLPPPPAQSADASSSGSCPRRPACLHSACTHAWRYREWRGCVGVGEGEERVCDTVIKIITITTNEITGYYS